MRAQLSIIGANEASHTVFLAKYPELNRTDLRPLRGYSGNQSFKELAANVVFDFFPTWLRLQLILCAKSLQP